MDNRLERVIRQQLRNAGRQFEEAKRAYAAGRDDSAASTLPTDDDGRTQLICRRHAARRAVAVDEAGRPACFEAGHPDCEGCVEDIRDGCVETWE